MVDIYEYTEGALSNSTVPLYFDFTDKDGTQLHLPIYGTMPDFGDNEPENYIVYTAYDTPHVFADNDETYLEYSVNVNIFTQSGPNPRLEVAIRNAMKSKDFVYQGSNPLQTDTEYPETSRKIQNYIITFLQEE